MKDRYILGVGYPKYNEWSPSVFMMKAKDGDRRAHGYIEVGERIPKSALTGDGKWRLILERVKLTRGMGKGD